MATPEAKVKQSVSKILKEHEVTYFYVPQNAYSNSAIGYPDICAYTASGVHFTIEVKAGSNGLSPRQKIWKEKLLSLGVNYFLFRGTADDYWHGTKESRDALIYFLESN